MSKWNYAPTAGSDIHGQATVADEDGKTIALVYDAKNAPVLAAGPELLETLEDIAQRAGNWMCSDRNWVTIELRAAIAKATEQ